MNQEKMEIGKKMDEALHYTAKNLAETGHNTKPVLLHSFKVAYRLLEYGYEENIVIAATLHDLIEDTDVKYEDIEEKYGNFIADLVQAVSFNPQIENKLEQAKSMFENCINFGKEALLIKCSDLIDNIDYIQFVDDKEKRIELLKKHKLFIEMSKNIIGNEDIYKLLENKIKDIE